LRLFDAKELALYNYLNNLEPVTFRITLDNPYKSVQQLMKKFVNDLQVNYPATVTTILKTGDKLTVSNKLRNKCEFCGVS
jgi:cytoplasmic tRNA 2-thiolation protein 2